jgi:hypothetical protein
MVRKLQWGQFINNFIESKCIITLCKLKYWGVPERLTDNLKINGDPIYALYYHGEMHTSKLETGLSDYDMERFKENIKKAYTLLDDNKENKNIKNNKLQLLEELFISLKLK